MEWKKLRDVFMEQVGVGTAGAEMDAKLRGLFAEIDTDSSSGIDVDELRVAVQVFARRSLKWGLDLPDFFQTETDVDRAEIWT